jgi:hypothetical protein
MTRAWTLQEIERVNRYGPRVASAYPWVRLIQRLCWQYGPEEALERLNGQQRKAA